jgi:hypothetical protein
MRIALIILLLWFTCAQAQIVEVSNPTRLPNKTSRFKILGKNNDGYIIRLYGAEDVINVYSEDLKLLTTKTIDYKNKEGLLQYVMLNKTGAVIFYLSKDKKNPALLAQPVNSKFIEIGKAILLDTIYDRKDIAAANLRYKESPDHSYLVMYYPYFSGNTVESIDFICIDRSLNRLYKKKVIVQRPEADLENMWFLVDNEANTYMVFQDEVKKGENSIFSVIRVNSSAEISSYKLAIDKEIFGEPQFELDSKNGNLIAAGFYDDDNKKTEAAATGFFYASYKAADGTENKVSYNTFSKAFMTELTGREAKDDKLKLFTFNVRKIVIRNDGGALISAESLIKDQRETSTGVSLQPGYTGFRTVTIYQYNDIVAFSINPDGTIDWNAIMRKKQVSEEDNGAYSSFLTINQNDRLRLLYLDEISTAASLNQYVLSSKGHSDRSVVFNQEEKDVAIQPKAGKQVSPNEVLLPSFLGGSFKLVKITF